MPIIGPIIKHKLKLSNYKTPHRLIKPLDYLYVEKEYGYYKIGREIEQFNKKEITSKTNLETSEIKSEPVTIKTTKTKSSSNSNSKKKKTSTKKNKSKKNKNI
jgi:hypothetical protein